MLIPWQGLSRWELRLQGSIPSTQTGAAHPRAPHPGHSSKDRDLHGGGWGGRAVKRDAGEAAAPMQAWSGIQVRRGKGFSPSLGGRGVEGWYCSLLAGSETSIYRALGDAQKPGATQARNVITKDMI